MTKVLIVDDEEMGRTVMEEISRNYGRSVSVSTGEDAVKIYKKELERNEGFDLVLLDISLEDISGLEVLKQIRAIEISKKTTEEKETAVVMVTAHSDKNIVIECIRAGCKGYFIKPLIQEIVDNKLRELGFKKYSLQFSATNPDSQDKV